MIFWETSLHALLHWFLSGSTPWPSSGSAGEPTFVMAFYSFMFESRKKRLVKVLAAMIISISSGTTIGFTINHGYLFADDHSYSSTLLLVSWMRKEFQVSSEIGLRYGTENPMIGHYLIMDLIDKVTASKLSAFRIHDGKAFR